jgi:hypothetical protein
VKRLLVLFSLPFALLVAGPAKGDPSLQRSTTSVTSPRNGLAGLRIACSTWAMTPARVFSKALKPRW